MTRNNSILKIIDKYRFEFLLASLVMLLFNKVFFRNNITYLQIVWPINLLILSVASIGLFRDKKGKPAYYIKNVMAAISVLIPFAYEVLSKDLNFMTFMITFFIGYYCLLFFEVFSQIVQRGETNLSVVLGAMSGYLLLVMIALFNFLLIELYIPNSYRGIDHNNLAQAYNDLTYYTLTLITSTGFGDITPTNDSSRLSSSFFSVLGQFYMVALVGIIISRFNSNAKSLPTDSH